MCVLVRTTAGYLPREHKAFHNRRVGCDTHCQINKRGPDSYILHRGAGRGGFVQSGR